MECRQRVWGQKTHENQVRGGGVSLRTLCVFGNIGGGAAQRDGELGGVGSTDQRQVQTRWAACYRHRVTGMQSVAPDPLRDGAEHHASHQELFLDELREEFYRARSQRMGSESQIMEPL